MHRCNINDSSPLAGIHIWQDSFGEQKWGREHEVDDLPPFRLWKFGNRCDILDACIVHQYVYLSFGGNSISHKPLNISAFRHIGSLETCTGQFSGGGLSSCYVDVRQRHAYTLLCKIASDRQSNTRSRSCHNSNLAFYTGHKNLLPLRSTYRFD